MSWIAASMLVLGVVLAAGFVWYERTHPTSRMLALIAALAALAALGRIAFAPLPSVKPTTDIVLLSGLALGGAPGFAVGAIAALASNLFFGQGPWTPWQMVGWGLVGAGGGLLARTPVARFGRAGLAAVCALAGLAYGGFMNFSLWVTYSGGHTGRELAAYGAAGLPFDVAHAIGNAAFCLAFGPALLAALRRFRTRFEVTWAAPSPAAAAGCALAVVLAVGALAPARAQADAPRASVRYLLKAQNADGGFGPAPGQRSTALHTGWAALGLAAAGHNPLDVRRGGRSVIDHLRAHRSELDDLGALNRTILVLAAAGRPPRLGGVDLLARVLRKRRRDGAFGGRVNTTAFAVVALRAAGRTPRDRAVRTAASWIARRAGADGGFNFAGRGGPSGVDDTSAAIQALAAAGRRRSAAVRRAVAFLERSQNRDGGFPLQPGAPSNAQSTAWAVQALVAAGRDPERVRRAGSRSPSAYLRSLVEPGGAIRYSRTSSQTPVWVTAQAVAALARRPFPLRPVRRRTPPAGTGRTARRAPGRTARRSPARTARRVPARPTASPASARASSRSGRRRSAPRARGRRPDGSPLASPRTVRRVLAVKATRAGALAALVYVALL